jgi:hypothetical protein
VKIQIIGGKVGSVCKDKKFVDGTQQCFAEKIKTKTSNVHDSLKVMRSNSGYLLKSSLL